MKKIYHFLQAKNLIKTKTLYISIYNTNIIYITINDYLYKHYDAIISYVNIFYPNINVYNLKFKSIEIM